MLSVEEISKLLERMPKGFKNRDDPFFHDSNHFLLDKFKKLGAITHNDHEDDIDDTPNTESNSSTTGSTATLNDIFCNVFGCQEIFQDIASYETHYKSVHSYICSVCRRSFPTGHLLDLHITEKHDTYFACLVDRGDEVFACILEECKKMFKTPEERKDHCIKDHKMPGNYRYFPDTKSVPDNTKHQNKKAMKNPTDCEAMEDLEADNKQELNALDSISQGKIKTFKFSFGHPSTRTFESKKHNSGKALQDMSDLKLALEETME